MLHTSLRVLSLLSLLASTALAENADYQSEAEIRAAEKRIEGKFTPPQLRTPNANKVLDQYKHIDPDNIIAKDLLDSALLYYDANLNSLSNQNYISIVNFSLHSKHSRLHIVDMKMGGVWSLHTAHGEGGDLDNDGFVEILSNTPNSYQSSEGFYLVNEIYYGKYGRSIRLDGLSTTNSNVRRRAIVIHGADYIVEKDILQGMSQGCFSLSWEVKDAVVDLIHGGSLLFAAKSQL